MGLFLSGAAVHDLKAAKQILQDSRPLPPGTLYADKVYIDSEWAKLLLEDSAIQILTPPQKTQVRRHSVRGRSFHLRQFRPAAD